MVGQRLNLGMLIDLFSQGMALTVEVTSEVKFFEVKIKEFVSSSSDVHIVVYDNSFQHFFETRILLIHIDQVEHQLNLDNFSF